MEMKYAIFNQTLVCNEYENTRGNTSEKSNFRQIFSMKFFQFSQVPYKLTFDKIAIASLNTGFPYTSTAKTSFTKKERMYLSGVMAIQYSLKTYGSTLLPPPFQNVCYVQKIRDG